MGKSFLFNTTFLGTVMSHGNGVSPLASTAVKRMTVHTDVPIALCREVVACVFLSHHFGSIPITDKNKELLTVEKQQITAQKG